MSEADPKLELIKVLKEMLPILEWDGSAHWYEWLKISLREIEASDYHGIERLSGGLQGGMGSFNDLVVGQSSNAYGRFLWREGYREMNDKLEDLRERAYVLVKDIQKKHEILN